MIGGTTKNKKTKKQKKKKFKIKIQPREFIILKLTNIENKKLNML
jgi:hypothetical protein